MRVRVAYTYYSEYCGGDLCEHEDEVPEGADLAAWLDENYPRDDYGEEGPFNHWSPSVYDEAGNLLYEREDA